MPYRRAPTECVVHLLTLRGLSTATLTQCAALRAEAARLWNDLVTLHADARGQGAWLSAEQLEQHTKGGQYALHSQSIQALCQKFAGNIATAQALRKQEFAETGQIKTEYPHHAKVYQTVVWKDQALLRDRAGGLGLLTGRARPPLYLPLPDQYAHANLRRAELTWRADHYELCLTLDTGQVLPEAKTDGAVAGVDLGEVHIAAITTSTQRGLVLSGRLLRSYKQGRNRAHATLAEKLARCQPGSRRAKRLLQRKAQVSAKVYRQQREILHHAAQQAVDFCAAEGVTRIAVGDVRDIQTGVSLGKVGNQKISQWPHGQYVRYLREKAARLGITVEWIDESYSTKTCSHSGHVQTTSPRGRRFRCAGCGARLHRDINGSNNICSKAVYGCYGKIQAAHVKYRRPIVVAPRHRPGGPQAA